MFVVYPNVTDENVFEKLVSFLIEQIPEIKNIKTITTVLHKNIITVLRAKIPRAELRCHWFTYIQVNVIYFCHI